MAEEDPLAQLVLGVLRRRRRAALSDIVREIFIEPRPQDERRVERILERLRMAGAVIPVGRHYYDARILRELALRRPGERLTESQLARITGIPLEQLRQELIPLALRRRYIVMVEEGIYEVPRRLWRIQKYTVYKTSKREEMYQVVLGAREKLPRQLVLAGYSESEYTSELATGTYGAVRIVVYTTNPEAWPEERLERILRAMYAQLQITLDIYSDNPNVSVGQAYEATEIEPDEKPEDIDLDEPQVLLWIAVDRGYTYLYELSRSPLGWRIMRRYRVI